MKSVRSLTGQDESSEIRLRRALKVSLRVFSLVKRFTKVASGTITTFGPQLYDLGLQPLSA